MRSQSTENASAAHGSDSECAAGAAAPAGNGSAAAVADALGTVRSVEKTVVNHSTE